VAVCSPRGAAQLGRLVAKLPTAALRDRLGRAVAAFGDHVHQRGALGRAALLSALIHGLNALSFWLVMHSLAIPASIWFAAIFYPLLSTLLALPVSVSGIGLRDVFAASMFTAFGLNPESGVAFSWLLLAMGLPNILLGGGIQLWEMFRRRS
ncbi:MAG TPA: lysylphosphatidylglycerol synthase domain-containing protein, partial [Phycisphaerae bacterium]|nr:lysylphosphatidylglycerol synthase domain-containing protein [Phycisphaerae bacterium]